MPIWPVDVASKLANIVHHLPRPVRQVSRARAYDTPGCRPSETEYIFCKGGMLDTWIHASTNSNWMAAANRSSRDLRFLFWGAFSSLCGRVALALFPGPGVVCFNSAASLYPAKEICTPGIRKILLSQHGCRKLTTGTRRPAGSQQPYLNHQIG